MRLPNFVDVACPIGFDSALRSRSLFEAGLLLLPLDSFVDKALEALLDLLFQFLGERRAVFEGSRKERFGLGLDRLVQRSRERLLKGVLDDALDVDRHA